MTITIRDVSAAIRKNGFKQAIGTYIRLKDEAYEKPEVMDRAHALRALPDIAGSHLYRMDREYIGEACAYGQAGINLEIHPDKLAEAVDWALKRHLAPRGNLLSSLDLHDFQGINYSIIRMNDELKWTPEQIADYIDANWPLDLVVME